MAADILIVSNDEKMSQLLKIELSIEDYDVLIEADSTLGFIALRKIQPRLLILDANTPGLSSIEILRRIRATDTHIKVILMTEVDKLETSEPFADDYIFKPLNLIELLLRVKLVLRQRLSQKKNVLRFRDLSLDLQSREVYRGERLVQLTCKEFDLLTYLLRHARQVIEQDRLLETVWDYSFLGNSNVLQVCIRSLRSKLEAAGEPRLIQTVRGIGYVLRPAISDCSVQTFPLVC